MNTMPKLILAILFFTSFSTWTHGQTLTTQAEVDAWDQTITDITGSVTISGDDITNIDALSNVIAINGVVNIEWNNALTNIDGFSNLVNINGSLSVENNDALTNINALSNITDIIGSVSIGYNDIISNIDGLSNLTEVSGTLRIDNNDGLTNINALSKLTSINGILNIDYNDALMNIDGLSNVTEIIGMLSINSNTSLTNIDGLSNLTEISGTLNIEWNKDMTNIDGLSNLTDINGSLLIQSNSGLTNIDGLSNLTEISGTLNIIFNLGLTSVTGLSNLSKISGTLTLDSNDALTNIDGLSNLISVSGTLKLEWNAALLNIDGLSNLTSVDGVLSIINNSAITNVDGLSSLTDVSGTLTIAGTNTLTNINGLANLTDISGKVDIGLNYALINIDALSNLTDVIGILTIRYNNLLTNIIGLSNLTTVSGMLNIENNDDLLNINALSNLTEINGRLRINGNRSLVNIDALVNLTDISGKLDIGANDGLLNIDGLSNLVQISGTLEISNNPALNNIDGLSNLTQISGTLDIFGNPDLTNIDGLSNVTEISGDLRLSRNDVLSECCVLTPHLISSNGTFYFWNNEEGCNSPEEILTSCGLVLDYGITPPCIGLENGVIDIFASNYDTIPFYYVWNSEDGLSGSGSSREDIFSIDGLGAGTYSITVTQPNGDVDSINNILLDPIDGSVFEIINITSTNSTNGFDNGSLDLEFSGGIAPFELSWSGPSTGNQTGILENSYKISNLSPGEYTIILRDASAQSKSVQITLLDEQIPVFPCTEPLDIVILNDVSGSVDATEYSESKTFFVDFLRVANIGMGQDDSQASIIEWSSSQSLRLPLTGDLSKVETYESYSRASSDGTAPHPAMEFGADYIKSQGRPDVEKVLILSTDGSPQSSLISFADELKAEGFHIVTIAFDYAYGNNSVRNILRQVASIDRLAPGAPAYSQLDADLAENIVNLYLCPLDPGSSSTVYFNRDGAIEILDVDEGCGGVSYELTFEVSASRELSIPAGTPIMFYHNNPTNFGATPFFDFQIPCAIPVDSSETYAVTLPITSATNLFVLLNDDGSDSPPLQFPITDIEEIAYSNNIDSIKICVDEEIATLQTLKYTTTPTPICDTLLMYTIDVCNISQEDATDISITDDPPEGSILTHTAVNTNGCAEDNGQTYGIPAGCCVSLTLTYDVTNVAPGYYGQQDAEIDGPTNQNYINYDGSQSSAEDVVIEENVIDCESPEIRFEKSVNVTEICEDGFLVYTFTIFNETNATIQGARFVDDLPVPMEWVYKPYFKENISISTADLSGKQSASFIIDEIAANTVATFQIDAYTGDWNSVGSVTNKARIENMPDFENGGVQTLESNTVATDIKINVEIPDMDTIVISANDTLVDITAIITGANTMQWTTGGDGNFEDSSLATTQYVLGAEDKLDTLISLFLSAQSECEEIGKELIIIKEPCERTTLATAEITLTCDEQTATLEVESTSLGSQHVFAWYDSLGELIGTGQEYETDEPGLFTIEITDTTNTCVTVADFIVDDVRTLPDTTILSTTTVLDCKNESLQLSIDQEDNVIYTWTLPDSDTEEGNEIQVDIGGMVILQATDTLTGCTNSSMITITEDKVSPVIDLQETGGLNCIDTIVQIDGTNSAVGEVTWLDSDKTELAETTNILEVNTSGVYYYHLVGTENGCEALDSITVTANYDEPEIDLIDEVDLGCEVDSILVTPTVSSNNGHTINWTYEGQDVTTENDLMASASGLYYIEVQDEVSNCKTRDSVRVNRPDEIQGVLLSQVDPLCFGEQTGSIEIQEVIGGTADFTYYFNDTQIAVKEIDELSAGTYTIKVEDAQGCDFDTIITLIESEKILANINLEEYTVQSGQDVEIRINTNIDEADISTITWSPDIDCENCSIYTIENITSNKTYTITVEDHNGCEESIEIKISVDNENTIHLPNILSIHEGNNMFYPKASGDMSVLELSVYDRWGNEVFRNENFAVNDGTSGWIIGTDSPYVAGVYVYYLLVQIENDIVRISGDVTLLR